MSDKKLHIISFNVPYPHNYGGVIDVFFKIKALHQLGVKITLHCFTYGRAESSELNKYTEKVIYYKRNMNPLGHFSKLPFIIKSRENKALVNNLSDNKAPILFEGIHSCYYLSHPQLKDRIKIVRTHNIEHDYYRGLAKRTKNIAHYTYFTAEALKLKRYEKTLKHASSRIAISETDQEYFQKKYGRTILAYPFHSNDEVSIRQTATKEKYILYHGALDVGENIEAALYLIDTFKDEKDISLMIAGSNIDLKIKKAAQDLSHITLYNSPDNKSLDQLISNAQVHVLPTFQATGVKLKLIQTLFRGRHIVCNATMVSGTPLQDTCHIARNADEFVSLTRTLLDTAFQDSDITLRKKVLDTSFSNIENAKKILKLMVNA